MECLTNIATEAVSKLGDLVVESTVKQFKYLIHHKKIIANLKEEHDKLKAIKQGLQGLVDAEKRKGYEIAPAVKNWLSDVEAIEKEVDRFYENEVNKNKKCFGGQCPDLAFNYSLGKRATKSIERITSLKEDENKIQPISYPKAPTGLGYTFTEDFKSMESRNKIISEVIEKLKDDNLKMISICGMGGVGKTTLVKELIKIVEKSKLFNVVVMAVVSQNPNYEKIQSEIATDLGLEFKVGSNMKERASRLLQRLKGEDKVLIVLDDVWKELNFEEIGLPSRDHQKGTKILLTSRNEDVCQNMGSKENFKVSVLLENEAWSLFREMAGDVVDNPDVHPIAKQVANECGGLPLAIVTVGRALENKEKLKWQVALDQLRSSSVWTFSDMQECVYSRIQLSFNILGREHKSCLLLCGLYPEDFDIPVESLLRYGLGLGLFKDVGEVWKARNQVNDLANNLRRCFLLLDSDEPGCVKMHDVVRDVALKIICDEEHGILVQGNAELKQLKQGKWLKMSLILDKTNGLVNDLECPTLELLQVRSHTKQPNPWLEHFFQGMSKLLVLALQDLCIPKIPSPFQALVNLHTLQVEGCDIGDISVIGKELKKLQILSFAYSNIKELPTEIGQLSFLRLLDLTGCDDLNFISTNVFARLSRLEELYFRVKNFPWMLNGAIFKELKDLSQQLKVLDINARKVEILPNDLIFKNLEKFWVYVVPYINPERHGYLESNRLEFESIDYNSIKSSSMIMHLVKKCENLILKKVKNLKNGINELDDIGGIPNLKYLLLHSCPNLEYVVDCSTSCSVFPRIKSLSLKNLNKLKEIFNMSDHREVRKSLAEFSYLEKLKLKDLPNLIGFGETIDLNEPHQPIHYGSYSGSKLADSTKVEDDKALYKSQSSINAKLFSFSWMKQFKKLETILLKNCNSLEMVFDLQGYSHFTGRLSTLLFPQLKEIEISYLNNLTYVWSNVPQCVQGFQNLRSLTISNCDCLKHIFTSAIVKAITNLEKLEVKSCKLMENLVVWSRENEEDNNKEWPSLRELKIDDCPMLEISLLSSHIHAKGDNLGVTTNDNGFPNFKENNSRSFNFPIGCMPLVPKFIRQGITNKRSTKEESLAQDYEPSIFEMKSKIEKVVMPTVEDLYVRKCDLLDVLFLLEENDNFINLRSIKIEECNMLKTIVVKREERTDMINSFAQLKSLHLDGLPNLVRFCFFGTYKSLDKLEDMGACEGDHKRIKLEPLIDGSLFPNLTSLFIKACDKIYNLFSYSSLRSLEKLEIWDCKNLEEIVSQEEIGSSEDHIMFPGLQHLCLGFLPNLKAFSKGSYNFHFPSLQKVEIEDCPNMEVFSRGSSDTPILEDVTIKTETHSSNHIQRKDLNATIQGFKAFVALQGSEMLEWSKLDDDGIFGYFIKNSEMNMTRYHKLLMLVPFNETQMLQLQHVRELRIEECDSLVEVFESGEGVGIKKSDVTAHYKLEEMELRNLPKLRHIWKPNITGLVSFLKLTSITIENCNSLKSLLSYSMARSLVHLQYLCVTSCEMMEEIVTKEKEITKESSKVKILFPQLKTLDLRYLPNLECVCSGDYCRIITRNAEANRTDTM